MKNEKAHPMKNTSQDGRLEVVGDLGDILVDLGGGGGG